MIKFNEERSSTLRKLGASAKIFIISILLLILCSCVSNISHKTNSEPVNIDKLYPPAELKEDLEYLFQTMENVHPNLYAFTSKEEIDQEIQSVKSQLTNPLTRKEFHSIINPIVIKFRDGHTWTAFPNIAEFKDTTVSCIFPLSVKVQEKRLFVRNNYSTDSSLVQGIEIISINGNPAKEIINTLLVNVNGYKKEYINNKIEKSFDYYYWGIYGFCEKYKIDLLLPDSTTIDQKILTGIPWNKYKNRFKSNNNKNNNYTFYETENDNIGIIDFRQMVNTKEFKNFLETTFDKIKKENIQYLIIDIRKNGGGDSRLGDDLINYITDKPTTMAERMDVKTSRLARKTMTKRYVKWYMYPLLPLVHPFGRAFYFKPNSISTWKSEIKPQKPNPLRFNGDTYLLTSGTTFSSASMLTSTFKCFELGTIVGEEPGGLTVSYGDIINFSLPNSGIRCGVSYKRFVQACGKEDGHGVIPDYKVKQTPEDRAKGIDTVMEFTKQLIRESESIGN